MAVCVMNLSFQMISESDSGLSSSPRMCTRGAGLYEFSNRFKGRDFGLFQTNFPIYVHLRMLVININLPTKFK